MLALRRAFLLGGLLAAASLSTGAHAAAINGSQALSYTSLSANTTDLSTVTSFNITLVNTTGGASQTGDFVGVASHILNAATLNTLSLSTFTFGSAAFGTFKANTGIEIAGPANTRTFYFSGELATPGFVPGTDPGYAGVTSNSASVLLNFTQSGGAPNAISVSGTLNTPKIAPPGVPEPASLAMAAVPALLGLIALRKRAAK